MFGMRRQIHCSRHGMACDELQHAPALPGVQQSSYLSRHVLALQLALQARLRKDLENVSDAVPDESEELFREPEQESNSNLNNEEENENGNS